MPPTIVADEYIVIIYNPNSAHHSEANARKLERRLKKAAPHLSVRCISTQYAGHGEELAYELARAPGRLLIVSSSGDGGYHEVINGVIRAGIETRSVRLTVCAVLPAGNANDHSRTMQHKPLWKAIKRGQITKIDLLKVSIESPGNELRWVRYAHSYVGLGLTPDIATELNRRPLNIFRETSLVVKMLFKYRPFEIRHRRETLVLDSLIFANINKMAKVLRLAKKNQPDDGRFEVIVFPHTSTLLLIKKVLRAATVGLKTTYRARKYSFVVVQDMPMQLDGEVTRLAVGSKVEIVAARKMLPTII
jgi:diacylglycerol kinase (ATP)